MNRPAPRNYIKQCTRLHTVVLFIANFGKNFSLLLTFSNQETTQNHKANGRPIRPPVRMVKTRTHPLGSGCYNDYRF